MKLSLIVTANITHSHALINFGKTIRLPQALASLLPHIARHGFATICFEANLNIKDVQEILGHAQYSTTSDIYTHLTQKHKTEALNKLNTYFENNY